MSGGARGQLALMAIAALALVVLLVVYSMSSSRRAEREVGLEGIRSESLKQELEKTQGVVQSVFEDSIQTTALELARHGGYASGNLPPRSKEQTPFWFYRGKVVNVPSTQVMAAMMKERMEWRISNKLNELRAKLRADVYHLGSPQVTVNLTDVQINARMELPVEIVQGEERAKTRIEFTHSAPLRLKKLRDLAEQYVHDYERARYMEQQWLDGVENDPRVPSLRGGGFEQSSDCSDCTVVKFTRPQMDSALREHARLHASMELQRARGLAFFRGEDAKDVQLDFQVNPNDLDFAFVANKGESCESETEVKLVSMGNDGSMPVGVGCQLMYSVEYKHIEFPVMIILRDLLKVGMAVTTETVEKEGASLSKPLEFRIFIDSYLATGDTRAVDASVTDPAAIDDVCQGSCSIDVAVSNANQGFLYIDSCEYGPGKTFSRSNVPCGLHTIAFKTTDPPGKAKWVKQDNIKERYAATIEVQDYAKVKGSLKMANRVYCTESKRIDDRGQEALGYFEGDPPRTIRLYFHPVSTRLGEPVSAEIDKDGMYEVPVINPGTYLVLAFPTEDATHRPTHKVLPKGLVKDIPPGENTLDITLEPLRVELVGEDYVNVVTSEEC